MQQKTQQKGRARVASRRIGVWEDPAWEDRFERLIKVTQRTALILELTGVDAHRGFIKKIMLRRLNDCGIVPTLPRGNIGRFDSRAFLRSDADRSDAAFLVALHYGPRGPGEFSEAESDLGRSLDKMLEVYSRYTYDLYPFKSASEPRLTFEHYVLVIQGIQAKAIGMHTCRDCGGAHPYSILHTVRHTCPFCHEMRLDMGKAHAEIARRLSLRPRDHGAINRAPSQLHVA